MTDMSPLTPNQKNILFLLAIGAYAEKTGTDAETAMDQLDTYLNRAVIGDGSDALLMVGDEILIRAPRAWLAEVDGQR